MANVLNIMLGRGLGGIEQVFLDYDYALRAQNNNVISVVHPGAAVRSKLTGACFELNAFSQYDWFAARRLRNFIQANNIEVVITHGNRATVIAQKACSKKVPIVSVAHNYKFRPLFGSDHIIAITKDLEDQIIESGFNAHKVHKLNNPIILDKAARPKYKEFSSPLRVGYLGRFVHKKGVHVLIEALKQLRERGVDIRAIFAGDGEEREALVKQIKLNKLEDKIELVGWVEDKNAFFASIDILVVPSLHEPFGVVVLEGFARAKPIIATRSEGPSEIIHDGVDGVLIERGSSEAITEAIEDLIRHPAKAKKIAMSGYKEVQKYDISVFAEKLQKRLDNLRCFLS